MCLQGEGEDAVQPVTYPELPERWCVLLAARQHSSGQGLQSRSSWESCSCVSRLCRTCSPLAEAVRKQVRCMFQQVVRELRTQGSFTAHMQGQTSACLLRDLG